MLYLAVSDIHLLLSRRFEDTVAALWQVLKIAQEHKVNKLLILGDTWTSRRPHSKELTIFEKWVMEVIAAGIEVVIIRGNHDEYPDGVHSYHAFEELKIAGVRIYSQPHIEDGIFMGHLLLREAQIGPTDFRILDGLSAEELIAKYPGCACYLLGDVHKPQTIQADPLIAYVGSLVHTDFGERGDEKRVVLLNVADGKLHGGQSIPIVNRSMVQLEIDLKDGKYDLSYTALKDAIVKIVFRGTEAELAKLNEAQLRDQLKGVVYDLKIETDVKKETTARDRRVNEGITPKQALELYVERLDVDKDTKDRVMKLGQEIIAECQY